MYYKKDFLLDLRYQSNWHHHHQDTEMGYASHLHHQKRPEKIILHAPTQEAQHLPTHSP